METRGEDGHPYPPSTLQSLLSGIHRVLQSNHAPFSVLDNTNSCFCGLLKTLDDMVPAQFVRVPSDFTVYDPSVYYEYNEFISKNNQHQCS